MINLKINNYLIIVFLSLFVGVAAAEQLQLLKSDGCSSFPDGTFEQNKLWLNCCTAHDYEYWKGGSYNERSASDKALKRCVAGVGEPEIALLMLAGVRVGGTPFFPTTFRWGYGWSYPRFYGSLTEEELQQVEKLKKPMLINKNK